MKILAKQYAESLAVTVGKSQAIDILQALSRIAEVVESLRLHRLWSDPTKVRNEKLAVAKLVVEKVGGQPVLLHFLATVIANNDTTRLRKITMAYEREIAKRYKQVLGTVESAVELTEAELKKIAGLVENKDQRVTLVNKIVENQTGGVVLRVGDKQYDASADNFLSQINQLFTAG